MCVTICGRFHPDEGAAAGYGNRIRVKYTAKWGVQIAGMIFQTRSRTQERTYYDFLQQTSKIHPEKFCYFIAHEARIPTIASMVPPGAFATVAKNLRTEVRITKLILLMLTLS